MGIFSAIRNAFGIKKDRLDIQKTKLEIEEAKKRKKEKDSVIVKVSFEQIVEYDPKTKNLIKKAKEYFNRNQNNFSIHFSFRLFLIASVSTLILLISKNC
jgi:hypothetical protein